MGSLVVFNKVLNFTQKSYIEKPEATPFVKWAGGKRQLIPELSKYMPDKINTYYEPFVGGGAVFFTFASRIERAILSDTNTDLILTYTAVKKYPDKLISALKIHAKKHVDAEYYNKIRATEPDNIIDIASRFIYLNKTCFNGLYRVNKSGKFNVPKGKYKNPRICDETGIYKASKVLQKATLRLGSYKDLTPQASDLIYCDPPYDDCFVGYQADGFDKKDQAELRDHIKKWGDLGANIIVSNSETVLIKNLYSNFNLNSVNAQRNINRDSSNRKNAKELIITNYEFRKKSQ